MNILIVDDERNIRLTLKEILVDEGYSVSAVKSGEEAISTISVDEFDMVILDVKLPGMDGIETLKAIQRTQPELAVVMISGHSVIETAVEAVKMGAYDFFEKPLSMAKILTVARNIDERQKLKNRIQQDDSEKFLEYRIIGSSPQIQRIREMIEAVSSTNSKVLIRGESGTGKELVAFAIHHQSDRRDGSFVRFNSAAIPDELVESELFGYEKGAFTGAEKQKPGRLELAHGGTLFLDEIGDMNLSAQAKVLRVIQEGTFERVGSNRTVNIDVRIIAATNKNLEEMINNGTFREDLYYRLNVVPMEIPPLRDREGDVEELTNYYLKYFSVELKRTLKKFSGPAMKLLLNYHFPGNVRELRNLIERLYIMVGEETINEGDLMPHLLQSTKQPVAYSFLETKSMREAKREFERFYLMQHLERFGWNISQVSKVLGMHQPNLSRKIRELGIKR